MSMTHYKLYFIRSLDTKQNKPCRHNVIYTVLSITVAIT